MAFVTEKRKIDPAFKRRLSLEREETRERQRISSLSAILNVMVGAVQKAGRTVVRDFGELSQLQVTQKGLGDFVSSADINVEKVLIDCLTEDRPDYGIISEEMGERPAKNDSPFTWIVDPIDGTTNFIHAIPYFSLSVALKYKDDITAAVVFNPITKELYYAEKGKGVFLMTPSGNKRLRVSGRTKLSESLLAYPVNWDSTPFYGIGTRLRHLGSTTLELASTAGGQFDALITGRPYLWDIAAGYLFIKEAGGQMATLSGKTALSDLVNSDCVIATNLTLFPKIQKILKKERNTK